MELNEIKKHFYYFGDNIQLGKDVDFTNAGRIYIGDNVQIGKDSYLCVHRNHNKEQPLNLKIQENSFINRNVTFEAFNQIDIGKYVMFGQSVYVSDNNHEYSNHQIPIALQGFMNNNKLTIKDGVWIGTGVYILGNVTVGFGTVIAANTVVNKDVPDHVVVGGIPAQVIKICDYRTGEWVFVKNNEERFNDIFNNRGIFNGYNYQIINKTLGEVNNI